jgi:hypothetical protein
LGLCCHGGGPPWVGGAARGPAVHAASRRVGAEERCGPFDKPLLACCATVVITNTVESFRWILFRRSRCCGYEEEAAAGSSAELRVKTAVFGNIINHHILLLRTSSSYKSAGCLLVTMSSRTAGTTLVPLCVCVELCDTPTPVRWLCQSCEATAIDLKHHTLALLFQR